MVPYKIKYAKNTTVIMTSVRIDYSAGEHGVEENTPSGPKMEVVKQGQRNLNNEELHNLNSSPNIIRPPNSMGMMWAGHVGVVHMGDMGNRYNILIKKLKEKRQLAGPRHRWEDSIKIYIKKLFVAFLIGFTWLKIRISLHFFVYLILVAAPCCLLVLTILTIVGKGNESKVTSYIISFIIE
jgi:hypothetical protein